MRAQVFISHSSEDKEWVAWIADQARALGIDPYLAEHDPKPGTQLSSKVRQAIRSSEAVLALLTTRSLNSPYVQQEIGVALEQDKLVVPLVHPDLVGADLAMLNGAEYIPFDFASPPSGSAALLQQLQRIGIQFRDRVDEAESKRQLERLLIVGAVLVLVLVAVQASNGR